MNPLLKITFLAFATLLSGYVTYENGKSTYREVKKLKKTK